MFRSKQTSIQTEDWRAPSYPSPGNQMAQEISQYQAFHLTFMEVTYFLRIPTTLANDMENTISNKRTISHDQHQRRIQKVNSKKNTLVILLDNGKERDRKCKQTAIKKRRSNS